MELGKKRKQGEPTQTASAETDVEPEPRRVLSPEEALNRKVLHRTQNLTTKANTQLAAAYRQKNLRFINMLIAEFAKRKELRLAKRAWNLVAKCELTPTVYTLTNMVNAYVRCGKMDRAVALMTECQHFLQPNEVTFTALIKGYGEAGQVAEAAAWVTRMRENGVELNLRTYQIILRSAAHWGYVDYATKWWSELCRLFVPSEPCLEYWIKTLCQAGMVTQAWEQIDLAEAKFALKATSTVLSDMATACAVAGLFPQARRALLLCRSAASSTPEHAENSSENKKNQMSRGEKAKNRRKMRKVTKVQASPQPEDKDSVFLLNRAAEVAESCKQTSAYLAGGRRSQFTSFLQCPRVLFLPSSHPLYQKTPPSHAQGFDRQGSSAASKRRNRKKHTPEGAEKLEEAAVAPSLDIDELNFQNIFKNKAKTVIEVCSGNGDWIIHRALSQPSVNWVAIEVRVDRCHAIFTRMAFQFVPNLLILCGDARAILHKVADASVGEVYVNYPEPPGDLEHKLLDGRFFAVVARVLTPKEGKLVVVSDDAPCIHGVLKALQKSQVLFPCGSPSGLSTSLSSPTSAPSELSLEDYGSSYFDKHWKQRRQLERFMLQWGKQSQGFISQMESKQEEGSKVERCEEVEQVEEDNAGAEADRDNEDDGDDEGDEADGDKEADGDNEGDESERGEEEEEANGEDEGE